MKRRYVLTSLGVTGVGNLLGLPTYAQPTTGRYPDKPIRIVVQFPPGTTPDNLARIAADHLQAQLKQAVVIDNRPGAAGNIAAEIVAKSPADGYTLLLGQVGLTWAASLFPKLNFDPMAFKPISIIADAPFVLAARPDLPVNNVAELIAYAKANPGKLTCGTSGSGSPQHLIAELFMREAGVRLEPVPYKGSTAVVPDLIAGRIDLLFNAAEGVMPFLPSGKLKALATVDKVRLPMLPAVPTLTESGIRLDSPMWVGLMAPPGTSDAITARISAELSSMRNNPAAVEKITSVGNNVVLSSPEAMQRAFVADSKLWSGIIRSANIRLD